MAFVIKEHRPGRWKVYVAGFVAAWLVSGLALYQYGWQQAHTDYDQIAREQELLEKDLEKAKKVNRVMQMQMSVLSRSAQIDREAKVDIARSIKALQDEAAELREEVSFYKGIISPEAKKTGLTIHKFSTRQAQGNLYHYKLILTQAGKNDRLVRGGVRITFNGVLKDEEKSLQLADLQGSQARKLVYGFRFFQELDGSFRLPNDYHPRSVIVQLVSKNRHTKITRSFDWHEVRDGDT